MCEVWETVHWPECWTVWRYGHYGNSWTFHYFDWFVCPGATEGKLVLHVNYEYGNNSFSKKTNDSFFTFYASPMFAKCVNDFSYNLSHLESLSYKKNTFCTVYCTNLPYFLLVPPYRIGGHNRSVNMTAAHWKLFRVTWLGYPCVLPLLIFYFAIFCLHC